MWLLIWLACGAEPVPVVAPATHSWQEEGELVTSGLQEVYGLWQQKQPEAARLLAERVYTDRWEPELERACREMNGEKKTTEIEYSFGMLLNDLKGNPSKDRLEKRIQDLSDQVRKVASDAHFRFPPVGERPSAPPPEAGEGSRPLVPAAVPNWERDVQPVEPEE